VKFHFHHFPLPVHLGLGVMKGLGLVRVINLNRQSYLPTLAIQKWFEQRHLTVENSEPVLILVEHNPGKNQVILITLLNVSTELVLIIICQ